MKTLVFYINIIMNPKQILSVLKERGFNIETNYWSPEQYENTALFMGTLTKHHVPIDYIENNIALFVLCENYEPFKNRINGNIKDLWLTKKNFEIIAQDCYDILAGQNDLEDWQIKLKESFKEMI